MSNELHDPADRMDSDGDFQVETIQVVLLSVVVQVVVENPMAEVQASGKDLIRSKSITKKKS